MKVSIIIPIYNVGQYLRQSLDSVYSQTDSLKEVILVNDGSTDMSPSIVKEYSNKYTNTIIVDKKNGGLSDARNAGTKVATGEYIYYLDSDDWLAPNAIKTLYAYAIENHCEVVQGGFYYAYDDHLLFDNRYKKPFVIEGHEAMRELIRNDYVKNFAWGKLYRSDIVKRHLFPKGKFFEDAYWQHHIIHETNRYGIVPTPLYYYRQRNTGISGTFSVKNLDLLKGYEERIMFIQVNYPEYTFEMATAFWNVCNQYFEVAKQLNDENVQRRFDQYKEIIENKYNRLFHAAMKHSLKYIATSNESWQLTLYRLTARINSRLFSHHLKRVDYCSNNEKSLL